MTNRIHLDGGIVLERRRVPAERLKPLVERCGGARYVAEAIGCDQSTVRRWMRDGAPMRKAPEIAHALGVTVQALTGIAGVSADPDAAGSSEELAKMYDAMGEAERAALWRVACALYAAGRPAAKSGVKSAYEAMEQHRESMSGPTAEDVFVFAIDPRRRERDM